MRRFALLTALVCAGCEGPTEIDCVLDLDPSIDPSALGALQVWTSGDETFRGGIDLPRGLPDGEARFVYRPAIDSGKLTFYFAALDTKGTKLADNSINDVVIRAHHSVPIQLTLRPLAPEPDMAVPDDLAAPLDSGTDGGAPDLPPGYSTCTADLGAILCDDFENGLQWNTMNMAPPSQTIAVDSVAHRGSHSLRVHLDAYPLDAGTVPYVMLFAERPISFDQPIWVRAWVRMDAGTLQHANELLIVEPGTGAGAAVSFSGDSACLTDYGSTMPPYLYPSGAHCGTNGTVKADTWQCFEWYLDANFAGAPDGGYTAAYVDGTKTIEAEPIYEPMFAKLWINWSDQGHAGDPAVNLWFDDVVISYQRIGCAQ